MEPETASERAYLVAKHLLLRGSLSMDEVIRLTGLKERGARDLMHRLSRIDALVYFNRRWYLYIEGRELPY